MNPGQNHSIPHRCARVALLLAAMFAVSISSACGKRGPLYLPDQAGAHKPTGEPAAKPTATQPAEK